MGYLDWDDLDDSMLRHFHGMLAVLPKPSDGSEFTWSSDFLDLHNSYDRDHGLRMERQKLARLGPRLTYESLGLRSARIQRDK
jgi:hypothetical protein